MPRENSFSDSDGRSLTPDLEDNPNYVPPASPTYVAPTFYPPLTLHPTNTRESGRSRSHPPPSSSFLLRKRFRHAVRKVIALHRGATVMSGRGAGAERGIDPRSAGADVEYGGIKQECVIEVADYSALRSSFGRMTNREFVDLMNDPNASAREPWVKVRWINIGGMDWSVIKALSIHYDLHPLALEDVFHAHTTARSKADYYPQHLFLRVLCHELVEDAVQTLAGLLHHTALPKDEADTDKTSHGLRHRRRSQQSQNAPQPARRSLDVTEQRAAAVALEKQRRVQDATLKALKGPERVNVSVLPMYIFLFRDGTVISIHSTPSLTMTEPITNRLRQFDTVLRTSADASLLVQSLLGLITDKAFDVVDAYQAKIKMLEQQILIHPTIETVRNLHILSADLLLHRRTLAPIKALVEGLRRYDRDRVAAVLDGSGAGLDKNGKVVGFMTHKTLTYLADVYEHLEYVLSQLDVIAGIGQNLVDYTFNMTSYEMNEVMRRLTLVSIIFLPLTLLAGYFGMNFDIFWIKREGQGDWIYWVIAAPVMVAVFALFLSPDVKRMVHYAQKRLLTRRVVKSFR
ncbi:hypothetical protein B0H19DRAFT_1193119 [Mycena capillaripes]|nr:hypothetical protein B0H19DRAFT_1193119 [Mycena capillaripes]